MMKAYNSPGSMSAVFIDSFTRIPIGAIVKGVKIERTLSETNELVILDGPDKCDPTNDEIVLCIKSNGLCAVLTLKRQ